MPRRPSASPKRTMCFLLRNRMAPVVRRARRATARPRTRSNHPATRSASASRSPSKPNSTSPAGAPGRARSACDGHRRRRRERCEHGVRGIQHPRAVAPARQQRELRARDCRARTPPRSRRGCPRSRRASRRSPDAGRRPPSRRYRPKSAASRSVCTTDVSWYSSSSTTRKRSRTSSATGGWLADDLVGAGDLVREVDHADAALLGGVLAGEIREQRERADLLVGGRDIGVDDRRPARRRALEHVAEPVGERGEVVERHEVVDAVARDPQRRVDDAAHRLAARLEPRVVGGEHHPPHRAARPPIPTAPRPRHPARSAPRARARSGRRSCCRSRPSAGAAARRRPPRCGSGARRRARARAIAARARRRARPAPERSSSPKTSRRPCACSCGQVRQQSARLELGEPLQPALDALGELARRLAGEGQAEHLVAPDDPVRDQPDDTRGHRLGLAAAGAGDDERRLERRLDDGRLLVGRRELPERGGDDRRRQDAGGHGCRHEALTAPIVWMRHRP